MALFYLSGVYLRSKCIANNHLKKSTRVHETHYFQVFPRWVLGRRACSMYENIFRVYTYYTDRLQQAVRYRLSRRFKTSLFGCLSPVRRFLLLLHLTLMFSHSATLCSPLFEVTSGSPNRCSLASYCCRQRSFYRLNLVPDLLPASFPKVQVMRDLHPTDLFSLQ